MYSCTISLTPALSGQSMPPPDRFSPDKDPVLIVRKCIQKFQDNANNTQVACSSRVSRQVVLRWCLVSECAEWRGWMWKRLIVARVFMCVLHQPSAIF